MIMKKSFTNLTSSFVASAFVAQGLEHWSCKPGVESSNLSEGFYASMKETHIPWK